MRHKGARLSTQRDIGFEFQLHHSIDLFFEDSGSMSAGAGIPSQSTGGSCAQPFKCRDSARYKPIRITACEVRETDPNHASNAGPQT
jgi:hypothetical protein